MINKFLSLQLGNVFFKYRGQIPLLIIIISYPIIMQNNICMNTYLTQKIELFSIILALIGLIIRYYVVGETPHGTSGKNRSKQVAEKLNYKGVYSISRNPLYFANFLIWISIAMFSLSYILLIISVVLFYFFYSNIILAEEEFLEKKFGEKYIDYKKHTPKIIPNFFKFSKTDSVFSFKKILNEEYSSTTSTVISFLIIDTFKKNINTDQFIISDFQIQFFCFTIFFIVIAKLNKKFFN